VLQAVLALVLSGHARGVRTGKQKGKVRTRRLSAIRLCLFKLELGKQNRKLKAALLPTGLAVIAAAPTIAIFVASSAAATATAVTSATTAVAPAAIAAATVATRSAVGSRASFVHGQIATAKLFSVELFNCRCGFFGSCHFDKSKAA
jgi:hypothetical protein